MFEIKKRYAKNSSGQLGAVPATYVELISDESNSSQQPNVDTTIDNSSEVRTSSEINNPPRFEEEQQQFMTSTPVDQSTDHELTTDSSFDSLSSRTTSENLLDATPITSNPIDSSKTQNIIFDPYAQHQEQQTSLLGDLVLSSPVSKSNYVYDTPSSILIPITSNEITPIQSMPVNTSNDLIMDNSSVNTTKLSNENLADSSTTKTKQEKPKLFSLKRSKQKPDLEKRRMSTDNGLDVSN